MFTELTSKPEGNRSVNLSLSAPPSPDRSTKTNEDVHFASKESSRLKKSIASGNSWKQVERITS